MNPLTDESGNALPGPEIKNQKSTKNDPTEKVSQKAFDQMKSEDLLTQIADKIAKSMLPFPSDSPFSDTDMIIFKDDYRGYLPLNGIKEGELKLITEIYKDISRGNGKISIFDFENNGKFTKEVLVCIKTLLTREIGRNLIKKVMSLDNITKIRYQGKTECWGNDIYFNPENKEMALVGQHPSGKLTLYTPPPFIDLGHEMIHMIHPARGTGDDLRIRSKKYHNVEEKITITGLKKGLTLTNESKATDVDDWSPIYVQDYQEINERNLSAAFAGSLTAFSSKQDEVRFPRIGHVGINVNQKLNRLLKNLVEANVLFDLENLIKENSITKEALNDMFNAGELHSLAIINGRADALKLLMKIDPQPNLPEGESLLGEAAKSAPQILLSGQSLSDVLDVILEADMNINGIIDKDGNTPLHYFSAAGATEAVHELVKKGGNIYLKNQKNQDPLEYSLSRFPDAFEGWKFATFRLKYNEKAHNIFNMMKKYYPNKEFLEKLTEANFSEPLLLNGKQDFILDYLDLLYKTGYDFNKLDKKGNTILHYAVLSCMPTVITKLKQQYNYDMNIKNVNGQAPCDYLINQVVRFLDNLKYIEINNIKLLFEGIYSTLKALEADLELYKNSLLLACQGLDPDVELHVIRLFKIEDSQKL